MKNETTKLNYANFPKLSELIQKNSWLYLTQKALSSDPLDFNVNAEVHHLAIHAFIKNICQLITFLFQVFTLTGSSAQQDGEMSALFRDSQLAYGENNVLGLLATRDLTESRRVKRQAPESSTQEPVVGDVDTSVLFEVKGKALFYSENTPVLVVQKNGSAPRTFYLEKNPVITSNEKKSTEKNGEKVFQIVLKYPAITSEIGVSKMFFL